jgi:hypothetical protein
MVGPPASVCGGPSDISAPGGHSFFSFRRSFFTLVLNSAPKCGAWARTASEMYEGPKWP